MKIALIILFFYLLISCENPANVDTIQKKEYEEEIDPNKPKLISDITYVNFDTLLFNTEVGQKIKLTNVSGAEYTINDIYFKNFANQYYFDKIDFPKKLNKDESIDLNIKCSRNISGNILDSLIIVGDKAPIIEVKSILPDIFVSFLPKDKWQNKLSKDTIVIFNYSNLVYQILDISFTKNDGNVISFDKNLFIGKIIPTKDNIIIPLEINTLEKGSFEYQLEFNFNVAFLRETISGKINIK